MVLKGLNNLGAAQTPALAVATPAYPLPPAGFYDKKHRPITLTDELVENIQMEGGTCLGTSEGDANSIDVKKIVRQARGLPAAAWGARHTLCCCFPMVLGPALLLTIADVQWC